MKKFINLKIQKKNPNYAFLKELFLNSNLFYFFSKKICYKLQPPKNQTQKAICSLATFIIYTCACFLRVTIVLDISQAVRVITKMDQAVNYKKEIKR